MDARIKKIKSAVLIDDYIYFVPGRTHALYSLDLREWSCNRVMDLEIEESDFWTIFRREEYLYIIPFEGQKVICIHLETHEIIRLELEEPGNIVDVLLFGDRYYLLTKEFKGYLPYLAFENDFLVQNTVIFDLDRYVESESSIIINRWGIQDGVIHFFSSSKQMLYCIDMQTLHLEGVPIPNHIICEDIERSSDGSFWLIDEKYDLFKWDVSIGKVEKCGVISCKIIPIGLYLFIDAPEKTFLKTEKMDINILSMNSVDRAFKSAFFSYVEVDDYYIVLPWGYPAFVAISKQELHVLLYEYLLSPEDLKNPQFLEGKQMPLNRFLSMLCV